jgi:hypothetical protein
LRVRAGAGAEAIGRIREPDDAGLLPLEGDGCSGLRDIDRCAGVEHAADRTAAVMGTMPGLVGLSRCGISIAVTDHGRGERVGSSDNASQPFEGEFSALDT